MKTSTEMTIVRVALANLRFPANAEDSLALSLHALTQAAAAGAQIVCFPECFVPGYRAPGKRVTAPDHAFLERAFVALAQRAASAHIAVVLGTERVKGGALVASTLVLDADGRRLGFQDKVQIDPSEEDTYTPGTTRQIFQSGPLTFGVVVCHEAFRYPETVRWAARRGAQIVFHPQFHEAEPGTYRPTTYGEPANSFHEQIVRCRAAENSCYFATVNYASAGSPTTSAIARPDGTLLAWQPYGVEGLLVADIELEAATGLLASRYKPLD
jgi:predicted amidohydrolase